MIDANCGLSTDVDSYTAGKNVIRDTIESLNQKPKIVVLGVDCLTRKQYNFSEIMRGVHDELGPDIPMIGSVINGMIINDRFALKSVGCMALGGDVNIESPFSFGKSRLMYNDIADKIFALKSQLPATDNRFMLMFQDGMKFPPAIMAQSKTLNSRAVSMMSGLVTYFFKKKLEELKEEGAGMPTVQELITELFKKGWDIPILGNCATDVRNYDSVEFYNGEVLKDAVLGAFLSPLNDSKFGFAFCAGAEPLNVSCSPTSNVGNFLLRIDGKPAIKGFCDAVHLEKESLQELKNLAYLNYYYMLGTREKKGDKEYIHLTATITDPNLEGLINSGFPFDKVPKKIEIFQSTMKSLLNTVQQAVNDAKQDIVDPKFLLGFDCAIRLFAYGDNLPRVISTIKDTIGSDVPRMILGSGGEIFATKEIDYYFNNMTFVTFVGGI